MHQLGRGGEAEERSVETPPGADILPVCCCLFCCAEFCYAYPRMYESVFQYQPPMDAKGYGLGADAGQTTSKVEAKEKRREMDRGLSILASLSRSLSLSLSLSLLSLSLSLFCPPVYLCSGYNFNGAAACNKDMTNPLSASYTTKSVDSRCIRRQPLHPTPAAASNDSLSPLSRFQSSDLFSFLFLVPVSFAFLLLPLLSSLPQLPDGRIRAGRHLLSGAPYKESRRR